MLIQWPFFKVHVPPVETAVAQQDAYKYQQRERVDMKFGGGISKLKMPSLPSLEGWQMHMSII